MRQSLPRCGGLAGPKRCAHVSQCQLATGVKVTAPRRPVSCRSASDSDIPESVVSGSSLLGGAPTRTVSQAKKLRSPAEELADVELKSGVRAAINTGVARMSVDVKRKLLIVHVRCCLPVFPVLLETAVVQLLWCCRASCRLPQVRSSMLRGYRLDHSYVDVIIDDMRRRLRAQHASRFTLRALLWHRTLTPDMAHQP